MSNPKSVYFAQRNPALTKQFRLRWRRHAALAMSMPLWDIISRYAQYDPITDPPAALNVTARYDAIGTSWFVNAEVIKSFRDGSDMQIMRRDEKEIFEKCVKDVAFLCEEQVLKDDGAGQFKIFCSLNRASAADPAEFAAALLDGFGPSVLAEPELASRLARLAICLPSRILPKDGGNGRQQDALIELSFHTLHVAAAFFSSDAYRSLDAALKRAAILVERCATRELLLYSEALAVP